MASLSTVARHWRVSPTTAKAILRVAGIKPLRRGRNYYPWSSIWRLEGATEVEPADFEKYREPLLDKKAVAERYDISERTARRWLAEKQVPRIRLSARVLRARRIDLDRADDALRTDGAPAAPDDEAAPCLSPASLAMADVAQ